MPAPLVTIAVPSFNQGRFLEQALASIFDQDLPVEVFVLDGGSTDESLDVIGKWAPRLSGWRSHPDKGQAAAINEGIVAGSAPYVCYLNSDDWFLPNALKTLLAAIKDNPGAPAAYGRTYNHVEATGIKTPVWVEPFNVRRLALRCIVSQPGTLIRRSVWEQVGGVDVTLQLAMDYDLWWRLYKAAGPLAFTDSFVAVNRDHELTKTNTRRRQHYAEAIATVRKHHRSVPLKWWLAQPYAIWWRNWRNN